MTNAEALGLIHVEILKELKELAAKFLEYYLTTHYVDNNTIWFEYADVAGIVFHVTVSNYDDVIVPSPSTDAENVIINFTIITPDGNLGNVITYNKTIGQTLQPKYNIVLGSGVSFVTGTHMLEAIRAANAATTAGALPVTEQVIVRA